MLHLDRLAAAWVAAHRLTALNAPMEVLSALGRDGLVWYLAAAALAIGRRLRWVDAGRVALALLVAAFLADVVLKPGVGRARPFAVSQVRVLGPRPGGASFPSGHAANAFAGALALSRLAPRAAGAWWALAIAIAFSRVYLGVHYPIDVIGGAAVGIASALLVLRVTRRFSSP